MTLLPIERKSHTVRRKNGITRTKVDPDFDRAQFGLGYLYRTIEEHINSFAAQEGCPFTVTDAALRMGRLLQDKALREQLWHSELVPEVRADGARAGLRGSASSDPALYVRAHGDESLRPRRVLSAKARKAISMAQRKRWRLAKRVARAETMRAAAPAAKRRPGQTANPRKTMSAYWAAMTPKQRSEEMARRIKVRQANAAKAA